MMPPITLKPVKCRQRVKAYQTESKTMGSPVTVGKEPVPVDEIEQAHRGEPITSGDLSAPL